MRAFDISPLLRSSIGYENLNRLVDFATRGDSADNGYPPYNIEKVSDGAYRIAMAVAGFAQAELDLTVQENTLIVTGATADAPEAANDRVFLHRGIAARAFQRSFVLADGVEVVSAGLENGLLNIDLRRSVPDSIVQSIPISRK